MVEWIAAGQCRVRFLQRNAPFVKCLFLRWQLPGSGFRKLGSIRHGKALKGKIKLEQLRPKTSLKLLPSCTSFAKSGMEKTTTS